MANWVIGAQVDRHVLEVGTGSAIVIIFVMFSCVAVDLDTLLTGWPTYLDCLKCVSVKMI